MIIIKNEKQIEGIRTSCKLLAELFTKLEEFIEPGMSTWDIDLYAAEIIRKMGGNAAFLGYGGFPGSICSSVNDTVIHGIPSKTEILKDGDIIGCDIGIELNGYYSDSAHTYAVGSISNEAAQLLKKTEESLYAGINAAVRGGRIKDIGRAITEYLKPYAYGIVDSFCGHGVGLDVHEDPQIPNYYPSRGMNHRLKKGMVLAIEPMINLGTHEVEVLDDEWTVKTEDRALSAHFEHTILITDDKPEILTAL
ncbi:MAG: type I methionyl aminopeptidase [Spirochaetaceae bacterium 4572_59]|nr:MAG: type I methionyl aminopeptidase [Spirochaetaceae bacterium 4572_59]